MDDAAPFTEAPAQAMCPDAARAIVEELEARIVDLHALMYPSRVA